MDVMHNKYFNYTTEEDPVVRIPCRFYLFNDILQKTPRFETVYFDVDQTGDFCPAEMSLSVSSTESFANCLKIIKKIQRYQTVTIVMLHLSDICFEKSWISNSDEMTLCDQIEKVFPNTIKFNVNTSYLKLELCNFSKSVFEHLAQELDGCKGIKFLLLRDVENNCPFKLGESIATMTSLETVTLQNFTSDICQSVLRGLSACSRLKSLFIDHNVLTDCLRYLFMDSNHYGFPCLGKLEIRNAKLSTGDVTSLANAVSGGKLPQLKKIDLLLNILTGKVGILMGFPKGQRIGYQALQELSFAGCMLIQADVRNMSQALAGNQFPQLKSLNLGFNTFTDCIIDLFGEEVDSSFPCLQELKVPCTQLSVADLRNISRALSHPVMSNRERLDLSKNKLTGIVAELFADQGLPYVSSLRLENTQLNARDIENIVGAIEASKLPALTDLDLTDEEVFMTEGQVKQLLEACTAVNTTHRMEVSFTLDGSSECDEVKERISERCKGTNVRFGGMFGRQKVDN